MSIFVLKMIAVFFMIVDHIKYSLPSCVNDFTQYFGRIAFPIFAFCTVQGYIHTRDLKKYMLRLFGAGIISQTPYLIFNSLPTLRVVNLNIMFTLLIGVMAIEAYNYYGGKTTGILAVLIYGFLAEFVGADYGIFGILLIFSFYIFKDSKLKTLLMSSIVVCGKYLYRICILGVGWKEYPIKNWICTLIPLFIVLLYNGKKGTSLKWFFYIFYPLHLLILWIISPYVWMMLV